MRLKKWIKVIPVFMLIVVLLVFAGCAKVDTVFNRDGSGTCTIVFEKDSTTTTEQIEEKINEVIEGVKSQSQKDRLELVSLTESENFVTAKMKFKKISETKGLGSFSFETGTSFGSQVIQRNLFAQLSKGIISSKNLTNYNNSTFTVLSDDVFVNPKSVAEETQLDAEAFKDAENEYYTDDNIFFCFTICGFSNISSISFTFPGEILVYGDLNATVEGKDTLVVTPEKVEAKELGIDNGVPFVKEGEYDLFLGYVVFELEANNTPLIIWGGVIVILGLLIFLGIKTGAFKRFFHGKTWAKIVKNKALYLFILPGFLLFAVFNYAPMAGIIVAFKNYTVDGGIFGSEWAGNYGFEHFITLFTHPGSEFGMIFRNTIVMALLKFITSFPAAIILALMFNALSNGPYKKAVQTISYLPYFVSWVVVSNIVYSLLSANGGVVNTLLESMGLEKIRFYSEPKYWWGILTVTSLWKSVGWGTIVYLAAITGINPDLYEAASIDGAGRWRQLWAVTIPGMMPVIGIQLILSAGNLIKDDFDQIYSLVGGSNYELRSVTEVFSSLVFRNLKGGPKGFSASTAISLIQSIMSLGLVLTADAIVRKTDNPGLW